MLPRKTLDAYTEWWNTCQAADEKFQRFLRELEAEGDSAEDLGDFVEGMATVRTFGPNPLTFPKEDDEQSRTQE